MSHLIKCPRCGWVGLGESNCLRCNYFLSINREKNNETTAFTTTYDYDELQKFIDLGSNTYNVKIIDTPNKTNPMTKIGNMMKRLLDTDTQTLVKASYINGDLDLTEKGKNALWAILFDANKAALVQEAQEELDAEKTK